LTSRGGIDALVPALLDCPGGAPAGPNGRHRNANLEDVIAMPRPAMPEAGPVPEAVGHARRRATCYWALGLGLLLAAATPAAAQRVAPSAELERAAFSAADRDGDGYLDEAELAADAVAAFVGLDRNGDGVLTPDELVGVGAAAFARIDINRDGAIDIDELRLHKLNAFHAADRSVSGQVSMADLLLRPRRAE
jgi:hypothetical protein